MSLREKLSRAAEAAERGWKSTPKKPQHSTSPPPPPVVAAKPVVPGTNTTLNTTLLPKPRPGLPGVTPAVTPLLAGKGTAPETTAKQSTMESYIRTYVPTRKKAMQIAAGVLLTGVAVGGLGWYLQNNRNSYLGSTNQTGDTRNSGRYGPDRHGTWRTQAPSRVHYARDTYPTGHRGVDPTASSYRGNTYTSEATSYQQAPAHIVPAYDGNPAMSTSFPADNTSFQPAMAPVNIPISANTDVLGTLASDAPAYHATTPIIPANSCPTQNTSYAPPIGPPAPTFDHSTINTNTFPTASPPYELPAHTGPFRPTYSSTADPYGRSQTYQPHSNYYPGGPSMGPGYGNPMRSGGGPTYNGMRPQYRRPMQNPSQPGLIETVGKGVGSVGSKVADGVGGILSGIGGVVGMLGQDADLKTSSTSV